MLTAALFPQVCNTCQGSKGRQHEPWKECFIVPQLLGAEPTLSKA